MKTRIFMAAVAWICSSADVISAGFDCKAATTNIEKQICANQFLSRVDAELAKAYQQVLAMSLSPRQELRAEQREWLRKRDRCASRECLIRVYWARLAELNTVSPELNDLFVEEAQTAGAERFDELLDARHQRIECEIFALIERLEREQADACRPGGQETEMECRIQASITAARRFAQVAEKFYRDVEPQLHETERNRARERLHSWERTEAATKRSGGIDTREASGTSEETDIEVATYNDFLANKGKARALSGCR